jgi:hypothetical protein
MKRGRKCKHDAMCMHARPYGRAERCGFGGRGVTVSAYTPPRARAPHSPSAAASVFHRHGRISPPVNGSPSLSLSLLSFMCCVGAHRTSLAPGPRPRRLAELRPCSPERHPSSSSPPNSAITSSPPSIFSAVASLQCKKAAAPYFSSSP